jgi:hypothetical protein
MMPRVEPRRFTPGAGLLDAGLPSDRGARLAARHAFIELRHSFLQALNGLPGAAWLVQQVQSAEEPVDLWLLRAPVFSALASSGPGQEPRDARLRQEIDSMFPDLVAASSFRPF